MKKYCPTHHFNFATLKCPFCEQERFHNLSKRYCKEEYKPRTVVKEREITIDDLEQLKQKFQGHL